MTGLEWPCEIHGSVETSVWMSLSLLQMGIQSGGEKTSTCDGLATMGTDSYIRQTSYDIAFFSSLMFFISRGGGNDSGALCYIQVACWIVGISSAPVLSKQAFVFLPFRGVLLHRRLGSGHCRMPSTQGEAPVRKPTPMGCVTFCWKGWFPWNHHPDTMPRGGELSDIMRLCWWHNEIIRKQTTRGQDLDSLPGRHEVEGCRITSVDSCCAETKSFLEILFSGNITSRNPQSVEQVRLLSSGTASSLKGHPLRRIPLGL